MVSSVWLVVLLSGSFECFNALGENVVPTESELVLVAQTAQRQWIELAGAMKPRPFYRNEIIKFEDETDNSEFGKTLRMLQEWQREHGDQATTSNLNRSLAAADVTYVVKEEDPSSSLKAGECRTLRCNAWSIK